MEGRWEPSGEKKGEGNRKREISGRKGHLTGLGTERRCLGWKSSGRRESDGMGEAGLSATSWGDRRGGGVKRCTTVPRLTQWCYHGQRKPRRKGETYRGRGGEGQRGRDLGRLFENFTSIKGLGKGLRSLVSAVTYRKEGERGVKTLRGGWGGRISDPDRKEK